MNDESTKPARMQIDGRQVPPWSETIHALRMDLRLAKNLRWHGTMFSVVSSLNMLLHVPVETRGRESSDPVHRLPRPGERWTCADPNTRTRNGRAWVVDKVLTIRQGMVWKPMASGTVVVFRDPDDAEHSCHVGASQLREWSPVPEGTLREVARIREFIRHGPCELTNKLEEAGSHCLPRFEGETHGAFRDRLAEALQAAGWHVGLQVAQAEQLLRRARKVTPARPDVADPDPRPLAAAAVVTCSDVVEGEYWEAPPKVVSCRVWRVSDVKRLDDGDVIVRMKDPRSGSPAGIRNVDAATMESDGWRRCAPAEPQGGEIWRAGSERFWRVVGHCLDGRVVMETIEDLTTGRVTRANVPAPAAYGWRRATPDEEQAARAADSRAVAK